MDNHSDDTIYFDNDGYCNYCNEALSKIGKVYLPTEEGAKKLEKLLDKIKLEGKGKKYDCLMGISGGLDSSYLAYLGYKWGLRILAVHVDDGYDTEITKENLRKLSKATNINIIYIVPDQEQYNDLIKAFLLAGVPNLAIPQDNILLAYLYKFAKQNKIKYFLSGGNFALESILQKGNTYTSSDVVNIKDIHKKYGSKSIDKLPLLSEFERDIDKYCYRFKSIRPLNYIEYNRERALKELHDFCDFQYYGAKHLENTLTKFIQTYYLPKKFSVDKRTSHLSSLIVSGQMTREEAIEELKKPLYDEADMEKTIDYVLKCLSISREDFNIIMEQTPKQHDAYKTSLYINFKTIARKIVYAVK